MFHSVLQSAHNAIRSSFILNGGAAVALLAFIGKLTDAQKDKIPGFAESLVIFVGGALLVTITAMFTYLTQWFYAGEKTWKIKCGRWLNIITIMLGFSSVVAFIYGMRIAYMKFMAFP